jgi:hypothetical protein
VRRGPARAATRRARCEAPASVSHEEWNLAERDGRELFERVKAELGGDWSIEWEVVRLDES